MNKDDISKIFQILRKATPEPVTELIYKTNFLRKAPKEKTQHYKEE